MQRRKTSYKILRTPSPIIQVAHKLRRRDMSKLEGQPDGADSLSCEKRSEVMSRVRSKNTKPEVFVRSVLHRMGYRFRIHRKDLPGNPDVVLPKHRTLIFVHGCFWHQHPGCRKATIPRNNREYWERKLRRNVERDAKARRALAEQGWKVLILWECEIPREEGEFLSQLAVELSGARNV